MILATHPFAPFAPSPLAERSANVQSPRFDFSFSMATPSQATSMFSKRAHKPNPLLQGANRDAATARRREMFFRRVQKDRDDKRWDGKEGRGEQVQRLDFLSQRQRWEAEKARQAAGISDSFYDVVEEVPTDAYVASSFDTISAPQVETEEVDYVLQQEEQELEAYIVSLEEAQGEDMEVQEQNMELQTYGSDDEDYDSLFAECINDDQSLFANAQSQPQQQAQIMSTSVHVGFQDADAMDTA